MGGIRTVASLVLEAEKRLSLSGVPTARLEAEILLSRRIGIQRSGLLFRADEQVGAEIGELFEADLARRESRYPLQYITGMQEFYSLDFEVDERVLIPRHESELIVDEVLRLNDRDSPVIVDVGTGSGCLAVALAAHLPSCEIVAIDISAGAIEVARRNAFRHGVERSIRFLEQDGLGTLEGIDVAGRVDFVVSNPPYIASREIEGLQPELMYEPREALTPGPDGLEFTERLVRDAVKVLEPRGWLLVELSIGRAERARGLFDPAAWGPPLVHEDLQGIPRLLVASRR